MIRRYQLVFIFFTLILFFCSTVPVLGQAPVIAYTSPQTYTVNKAITALSPTNTGGAVPATVYGQVSTFAGNGSKSESNGTGTAAGFYYPAGMATDVFGNMYVADYGNNAIRKITPAGVVSIFAGNGTLGFVNANGTAASFNSPIALAVDGLGNIYVSDPGNFVIRKITPGGTVSTYAGNGQQGYTDGPAGTATFNYPYGLTVDNSGNLYVADYGNNVIRKVTPDGAVSTFAGNGSVGNVDGSNNTASFKNPTGIVIDGSGNLFVTDWGNNLIREVLPSGVVSTFAGNGTYGSADGAGTTASFSLPNGIAIDPTGNLYIADQNNQLIRKISKTGVVTTVAGSGSTGTANGGPKSASFNTPMGLTLDGAGNLYVADYGNNLIRKVTITGYTIDKTLPAGLTFDQTTGIISGTPTVTSPATGYTITGFNASGSSSAFVNITVNDGATVPPVMILPPNISYQTPQTYQANKAIASLTPTNKGGAVPATIYGQVSTYAGLGFDPSGNPSPNAIFSTVTGVGNDAAGNVYLDDWASNMIKEISATTGAVTIVAGSGNVGADNGAAANATFNEPDGMVVDGAGNVYIGDQGNNLIREISIAGIVTTVAGSGAAGNTNGVGGLASFSSPRGLALDGSGNLYVADQANNLIKKISPTGLVTTFAGSGATGLANGTGTSASFNTPTGIGVDVSGNAYVADAGNNAIRKITHAGIVTTLAGNGSAGFADGAGNNASFNFPREVRADGTGNLYVTDAQNNRIRRISPSGVVTTIAGNGQSGSANGAGNLSSFNGPLGLTLDGKGNLYVGENGNSLVRKIIITGYTIDTPLPAGLNFDQTTGVISGTPTATSPATDYTITGFNASGGSSAIVNIAVTDDALLPSIINFPPPQVQLDPNNNFNPGATSTNTETPIVYTSSNPSVATVTPDGLIHVIAPGQSTITATQAGNANYSAATPATELLIVTETQVIKFPDIPDKGSCDADFAAGAVSSNATIPLQYSSSNPAVATISSLGIIHIVGVGITTITVSQDGNTLFSPAIPQTQLLMVTAPVAPTVTISANSPCAGMPFTFTAAVTNGNGNELYQWQINGIDVLGSSAVITFNTITPTDVIQCVVTNKGTCPVSATSNALTGVKATPYITPTVSIQTSAAGPVCSVTVITFTATPVNGGTNPAYQWQVNGVNAGTNNAIFAGSNFQNGDVITCTLTNTSSPCLTVTAALSNALTVSLIPPSTLVPSVTINPDYIFTCDGFSATYTAVATDAGNNPAYQWKVNGVNAGVNSPEFTSSSLQTGDKITCTIISSIACSIATATSNEASIEADPLITNTVSITSSAANNIISPGQVVTFTAKTAYATEGITTVLYQWMVNGIIEGTNNTSFVTTALVNGDVVTCLIITTGKCIAAPTAVSNDIKIIVITPVIINNTFTPNGDGVNDTWDIPSLDAYPGCNVSIFTRYGTLVYNSISYPKAWDGTYKGSPLPAGTYYYLIDLKNDTKPLSGFVVILR